MLGSGVDPGGVAIDHEVAGGSQTTELQRVKCSGPPLWSPADTQHAGREVLLPVADTCNVGQPGGGQRLFGHGAEKGLRLAGQVCVCARYRRCGPDAVDQAPAVRRQRPFEQQTQEGRGGFAGRLFRPEEDLLVGERVAVGGDRKAVTSPNRFAGQDAIGRAGLEGRALQRGPAGSLGAPGQQDQLDGSTE